ncbi:MAG: serine/threonine-protein kinase [Myxococcota bacterium]
MLERLGAGGMGIVVAAYDPDLDRKVAIKILNGGDGGWNERRTARLQREAKALARLVHPNVVSVFDVGSYEGSVFVAMEYVDGTTLGQRMGRMGRWRDEPPPWRTIVSTFIQAGEGLAAAHDAGLVHRDFKPANAMVTTEGRVVVLDFGLANQADDNTSSEDGPPSVPSLTSGDRLTRTGAMIGTPAYMSPEQMSRRPVGPASDQFSFCVALFQALYGQRPFSGDSLAKLVDSVLTGEIEVPPSTGDVPARVHKAVLRGLSRKPEQRFESMTELLDALREPPASPRRTWLWLGGAAVLAAVASTVAVSQRMTSRCDGVETGAKERWNEDVAAELATRFEQVDGEFGRDVADVISPKLDEYVERWTAGRRDACEATHVRKEASDVVLLSRFLCYERSLAALDGWLTIALAADKAVITGAPLSIGRLPTLTKCESNTVNLRRAEVLSDPQARAEMQRIEASLDWAATAAALGQMNGLESSLIESGAAAEAIGASLLASRAKVQHALLLTNTGQAPEDALKIAKAGVLAAEASGDDLALMAALRGLIYVVGFHMDRLDEARAATDRLQAVVARNGDDPLYVRPLLVVRGKLDRAAGDDAAAIETLEAAVALTEEHDLPFDAQDIEVLSTLATCYVRKGRYDEAEAAARRALALGQAELGKEHTSNALSEVALARVESGRGNEESALAAYRRAAAIFRDRAPADNRNTIAMHNEIGRTLNALGRTDEALAEFEAGLEPMRRVLGADHVNVASFLSNIGIAQEKLGMYEKSIDSHEESLRIKRKALGVESKSTFYGAMNLGSALKRAGHLDQAAEVFTEANGWRLEHVGPEDPFRAEALFGLGEIAHERGDLGQANEHLTRAVALLNSDVKSFVQAKVRFALAKLRWDLGEFDEARALARAAIENWESGTKAQQGGLSEARAWLSNHSRTPE